MVRHRRAWKDNRTESPNPERWRGREGLCEKGKNGGHDLKSEKVQCTPTLGFSVVVEGGA